MKITLTAHKYFTEATSKILYYPFEPVTPQACLLSLLLKCMVSFCAEELLKTLRKRKKSFGWV